MYHWQLASAEVRSDVFGEISLEIESIYTSHWVEPSGTLDYSLFVVA